MPDIKFITKARKRLDKSGKEKPNLRCELDDKEIKPGDSYRKATGRRSGGFYTRTRCADCPTWQQWDLSDSLPARLAEIVHVYDAAIGGATSTDDFEQALSDAQEAVEELAQEKRDGAENMEAGFGHETEQSQQLNEDADQLDDWANSIESAKTDIPDLPEPEDNADELTEDQIETWRDEAIAAITVMDDCPL